MVVAQEPTVKSVALVAVSTPVATVIFPVVDPACTTAVIWVGLNPPVEVAVVPLNLTVPSLVGVSKRFVPVIVTDVPCVPHVGVNEEMVGAQLPVGAMVKSVLLVAMVPLVTWMGPVVVPVSTSARISVPDTIAKEAAACPLKSTAVTSGLSKFDPVIVTTQPFAVAVAAGPPLGVNDVIVGAAAKAGASRPSTSRATATPTPATRRPMCRFKSFMTPSSLSASPCSRLRCARGAGHPLELHVTYLIPYSGRLLHLNTRTPPPRPRARRELTLSQPS
jgi:hypothetical protein